jgi:hypothetical protein
MNSRTPRPIAFIGNTFFLIMVKLVGIYGQISWDFVFSGSSGNTKLAQEYLHAYVISGANDVTEIAKSMKGFGNESREYWTQVFLDDKKYNIKKAPYKSLLRRSVERPFARPFPEHKDLWSLMIYPLQSDNAKASR